jgi:hypothetical protein
MNREEQKQLEELKKKIEKLGNYYWLKKAGGTRGE